MSDLSVIIPVYQVEKYLKQCVDSVLAQTIQNMVIYLVDDGSEDESAKICDEYAKKDDRIIVIHRQNGGLSEARNTALKLVNTPYVTFLDSDDYLSNIFAYEYIIKHMKTNNSDICLFAYKRFKDGGISPETETVNISKEPLVFSKEDFENWLTSNYNKSHPTVAWNKIYKSDLFANLRFEAGNLVEDTRLIPLVFEKCHNFLRLDYPLVFYRERISSQSHGRSIKMCCDHVLSETTMLNYVFSTNNKPLIEKWLIRWIDLFFTDYFEVAKKKKEFSQNKKRYSYWEHTRNNMQLYYAATYSVIKKQNYLSKKAYTLCWLFSKSHMIAYLYYKILKNRILEN